MENLKNKKRKILKTTLTSGVVAASVSAIMVSAGLGGNHQEQSTNKQSSNVVSNDNAVNNVVSKSNNNITFNGNTYSSADEAVKDVLKNVQSKEYLGDVSSAISATNHNAIDTSKLIEKNSETMSKIQKAYKTLSGGYTSSYRTAQESYVKDRTFTYRDNQGNEFDSELDAINSIKSDYDSYSNDVAYYTVKDYSKKDGSGNPTSVNINPLNKEDVQTLKNLAVRNIGTSNSGFTVNRYLNTNKAYGANDFIGETNAQVQSRINSILTDVSDIVKHNLWLNTSLSVTPDKKTAGWSGVSHTEQINWTVKGNDKSVGQTFGDMVTDARYLTSNDLLTQKFDKEYPLVTWRLGWHPFANLKSKGKSMFGTSYDITLDNGVSIFRENEHRFNNLSNSYKQADFLGAGNWVNGYFSLSWNQDELINKMQKESSFATYIYTMAEKVRKETVNYLKTELSKLGTVDSATETTINNLANSSRDLITKKIFNSTDYSVTSLKNVEQIRQKFQALNTTIINLLDGNSKTLSNLVTKFVEQKYQTTETQTSNNVIYTIDYNNVPLFWIQKDAFKDIVNTEDFKAKPLNAVKTYFNNQLKSNFTGFSNSLVSNLKNVSNSLNITNSKFNGFSADAITNYNDATKKVSSMKLESSNVSNFSVKKVDQAVLNSNGINTSSLNKSLNLKEEDAAGNLNSSYGTFQAIYGYNKDLDKYSKLTNVSDAMKQEVTKNAITDPNDIVVLYAKDKTPEMIRYGKVLNYGYKFNVSLSTNENKIYNSVEKITYDFSLNNLGSPVRLVTFSDYDGNLLVKEVIDKVGGTYDAAINQAYQNAINKVELPATSDFVYYTNDDETKTLVKNESTKLYVVSLPSTSTVMNSGVVRQNVRAGTTTYGFVSYSDLQSYVKDEVYVANGLTPDSGGTGDSTGGSGGGNTVTPTPTPPTQVRQSSTDVTQSVIITVTLMLIVEGALLFIYVYSKFKSKDAHIKKLDSTSNLIYKLNVKK